MVGGFAGSSGGVRTAGMFASADGFFLRRFRQEPLAGCAFACDAEATRGEALGLAASLAGTWTEGHLLSRCVQVAFALKRWKTYWQTEA